MKDKILVVIPAYNCEKQITRLLSGFNSSLLSYIDTILVINNKSTDDTEFRTISAAKNLEGVNFLLLRNTINYGYGGSLKIGFEFSLMYSFDYVIVINGDDQSPITDFLPILQSGEYKQFDVMWGSRFIKKSSLCHYPASRIIANYIFNLLFSIAVRKKVTDIGCGVYMYNTNILKDKFYLKMPDVLYIGSYQRLAHDLYHHKIREFPINWNNEDQESTVKIFSQTFAQFKLSLQYLLNRKNFLKKGSYHKDKKRYVSEIMFSNISSDICKHYIQPGKPAQNGFIELFNRTYRENGIEFKHRC